ncbi:MAG: hypothetical protein ACI9N3_000964 [Colwellia sp.]|jgi:hypothetical protein
MVKTAQNCDDLISCYQIFLLSIANKNMLIDNSFVDDETYFISKKKKQLNIKTLTSSSKA